MENRQTSKIVPSVRIGMALLAMISNYFSSLEHVWAFLSVFGHVWVSQNAQKSISETVFSAKRGKKYQKMHCSKTMCDVVWALVWLFWRLLATILVVSSTFERFWAFLSMFESLKTPKNLFLRLFFPWRVVRNLKNCFALKRCVMVCGHWYGFVGHD